MSTVAIAKTAEGALLARIHASADAVDALATDQLDGALERLQQSGEALRRRLRAAELLLAAHLKAAADALEDFAIRLECDLSAPPPPEARAEARRDELVASRLEQLAASDRERHASGGRTSRVGALVVLEEGASEPGTLSRASADTTKAVAPERGPSAAVVADDPEADLTPAQRRQEAEACEMTRELTDALQADLAPAADAMTDEQLNALATRVGWPQPVPPEPPAGAAANGRAKSRPKTKRKR